MRSSQITLQKQRHSRTTHLVSCKSSSLIQYNINFKDTKVYLVLPFYERNETEDGEEDVTVIGNTISFFVNCIPTQNTKADQLEPFLMTRGNMTSKRPYIKI